MKSSDAATALPAIPATSSAIATPPANVYNLSRYQTVTTQHLFRARWEQSEHIEDIQMFAKIKALSDASKSRVRILVSELYEVEVEARRLQQFGRSRKILEKIWDNPDDAEYNSL